MWDNGVLIGFPMVDMKVTLFGGLPRGRQLGDRLRDRRARAAMKEGCDKGGVKLLGLIMDVEVVTPGDFVGGVIGDINSRRGQIRDQRMRGNATVVRAFVPLANMFGYIDSFSPCRRARLLYDAIRPLRRRAAQRRRRV